MSFHRADGFSLLQIVPAQRSIIAAGNQHPLPVQQVNAGSITLVLAKAFWLFFTRAGEVNPAIHARGIERLAIGRNGHPQHRARKLHFSRELRLNPLFFWWLDHAQFMRELLESVQPAPRHDETSGAPAGHIPRRDRFPTP